ncbi:MAG: glycosyltransferase family 2 protein [Pyrinomonadaceae bacterium]
MKISAKIIVFNEEENIADVCETVSWADEIVIVDSDSTDRTVEIARKYTDKIFNKKFEGYKDKHIFADSKTSHEWIFWIDADERVTPELKDSILRLKERADESLPEGFRMARKTWYLGRWIKHSGWYPDIKMRLYRADKSYWDGVSPHETARVNGKTEMLEGELLHYTKKKLSEHHRVLDSYTTLAAEYHRKNGREVGGFGLFFNPVFAFLRSYVAKQGFRDGIPGLIIAIFNAYSVFLKYAKIWEDKNVSE